MLEKIILYVITEHRGKAVGIFLGLAASILFINYGFWRSAFIVFCIFIGYQIGKKLDENADLEIWMKNLFKSKNS